MTQQEALEILKMGYNVFLTGPPGSGKTFLLKKYIDYLLKRGKGVAVTASTGVAATHLNGRTIHSWSGMGIKKELKKEDLRKLLKRRDLRKRFKTTGVLIIDEVSMLHAFQFDLLNRICQVFKNSFKPFGGMQIVCSGDLFQLPPVAPVAKEGEVQFLTESEIWKNMMDIYPAAVSGFRSRIRWGMKICYLEEQYRQKDDSLRILLNYIRSRQVEKSRKLLESIAYNQKLFPFVPTKLYTHNVDVDAVNRLELNKIQGKKFTYHMAMDGPKNLVEALKKSCLSPQKLVLKKGAKVMFVKNNFKKGYVNGTLGSVIGFGSDNLPVVGTFGGRKIVATPALWKIEEEGRVKAEVKQIPLRLAWAITVHKSQGMNLDAAEIDLSRSFVEGMGYVALSRLGSLEGLRLKGLNRVALCVNEKVLEMDKKFKMMSQKVAEEIRSLNDRDKKGQKEQFLNSLPIIGARGRKKEKRKVRISTYQKTRELLMQGLSVPEIARERRMKQETIIGHLEKLVDKGENVNLQHLRLPGERFQKIKNAFQKTGSWRLSPVKEILGDSFCWLEIKIARLLLKKEQKG